MYFARPAESFKLWISIVSVVASCVSCRQTVTTQPGSRTAASDGAAVSGAAKPAASNGQQSTAEPAGKFIVVNGHRLWYRIAGQGPLLLLIPGGPGVSHKYLFPGLERLTNSFQVIYFDAFGRGQSDRAQDPGEYSFEHDIEELEGLRVALGLGKIVVYGHSYGGLVAQGYALRYPSALSHLVLANTLHSAEMWQKGNNDTTNAAIENQFPEISAELHQLRAKGAVSCDAAYQAVADRVPPSLMFFYDPSHANVPLDMNSDVYCQIAGRDADVVLSGDLSSVDFRRRLHEIPVRTLVLAGRFDRVAIPRYMLQYRTLMPQAELVMFEHSGHFPFIEEPERHDAVVRAFLSK